MAVITDTVVVTPALAADMLSRANYNNRPLMKQHVRYLAEQMKKGHFQFTHQGIAFTSDGRLLDGQHRLAAIVESGTQQRLLVFRDVDPAAYLCIDQGKRKSSADVFGCTKHAAHVARLACYILTGNNNPDQNLVGRLLAITQDASAELDARCNTKSKTLTSTPVRLAAVIRLLDGEDRDWVLQTWDDLANVRIAALPAAAQSLVAQAIRGSTAAARDKLDLLARGLVVFTRARSGTSRIQVNNPQLAREYVRSVLARYGRTDP